MLRDYLLFATNAALVVGLAGCNHMQQIGEVRHETKTIDLDNTETVRVEMRMGAGELHLSGGARKLMESEFTFNVEASRPQVEYRASGSRGDLRILQPNAFSSGPGMEYDWDIRLNDDRAMDLIAKLGAGEAMMDLGTLNLRDLEINQGVGELKVDLRGKPKRSFDVRISGGVGEATVYLPKSVGIVATAKGGIGDLNVDGLEKRGGYWYNPSHENDAIRLRLDVKGGVGEIHIIAE
jgi:translation elongation factor EF-G